MPEESFLKLSYYALAKKLLHLGLSEPP